MKVLLADPQPNIRYGLKVLISEQPGLEIIGCVVEHNDLMEQITNTSPDLLLLSWQFISADGADLMGMIKQQYPGLYTIVMSSRSKNRAPALTAGADAYISQAESPEKLLQVIRQMIEDRKT